MRRHVLQRWQTNPARKTSWLTLCIALLIGISLAFSSPQTASVKASSGTRDPLVQPFASTSIWNMPIGSNASYVAANIPAAGNTSSDADYFITTSASDPQRNLYDPGAWGPGRCTGTQLNGQGPIVIPDNTVVPDATSNPYSTPNNAAAILQPDGKTLVQIEPLARCSAGGNVYGYRACNADITGDGICGGHFGSGLSSIGGMIRLSELQASGDQTIPHALQLEIWDKYLYACNGTVNGYRWPADRADSGACDSSNANSYKGTNASLMQGSLLALSPTATLDGLGIKTDAGRKMFYALQNYGGYVVDDTGWDDNQIGVENTVPANYDFGSGDLKSDINSLFSSLQVIDNNSSSNIGGGGTLRAPLAPPLDGTALDRSGWTARGTSSNALQAPFDGDSSTRWTTETAQTNNQFYQIDMGQINRISSITLDSSQFPGDYPRQYIVFLSTSNWTWGNAVAAGSGNNSILTISFSTQSARYITIQQTGSASNWWSIGELNVYP
ncbi:discoidin domain-containing protein [Dictyobacter kobayashii]|uniref:F5/8 type C domain-containing protein n=1 Tax=Dictyobacter kobayashii TaxID=2014872 RepID=A0A402ATJ8_9CHLR|nr:discoidin domain-containing protein [Dictyobacter kobayashii]GCE22363.1 hypothetical protein KDK_61630 [Dictyobacter kobayashii]